jgi:hypothetical protein
LSHFDRAVAVVADKLLPVRISCAGTRNQA